MGFYHLAQICTNGHLITGSADEYPELCVSHCIKCGAPTITHCPSCSAPIHGNYDCGVVALGGTASVGSYCHNCGKPYPWTEIAIQSAQDVILEDDSLNESLKNSMVESLPDIISETPQTNLAVVRMKKVIAAAGKFSADSLRQFVIDFGCELAKNLFGL